MSSFRQQIEGKLRSRRIIVGVTGGIAAYKSALIVRHLRAAGSEVQVMMTPDAARFISPLTLGTLSGRDVPIEVFPEDEEGGWTRHVHLGRWADLIVVAPATAQTMAKLAAGNCDSMLTATILSATCPVLICPAMDHDMYVHPATQRNLSTLREYGYEVLPPEQGELASGLIGEGRLPEPEAVVDHIIKRLNNSGPLAGKTVLITAGPTQEPIDPVRYISNHSTGRMGYALAEEAQRLGASVTLVSGPVAVEPPRGVEVVNVITAADMAAAVEARAGADVIVMAAAVADYTPENPADKKIKKSGSEEQSVRMTRTVDILQTIGQNRREGQTIIGFALETHDAIRNARAKLEAKGSDFIVLNSPTSESGFATETNRVTILGRDGTERELPLMTKADVAAEIFRVALSLD